MGEYLSATRRSVLLSSLSAALAGCTPWENAGFNYSLAVTAEHNGQTFAGHSVIHVGWKYQLLHGFDGFPKYRRRSQGEALVLESRAGTKIFALIAPPFGEGGFSTWHIAEILKRHIPRREHDSSVFEAMANLSNIYPIPSEFLPILVSFGELSRPETAKILSRASTSFTNHETRLLDATIQVTDRDVTKGIEKTLPWLSNWPTNTNLLGQNTAGVRALTDPQRLQRFNFQDRGES